MIESAKSKTTSLPCVLACSGCSKAGELADRTARRMDQLGLAKMSCLAGIGGRVKSILNIVASAPELLMIDGCPLACGANSLKLAGVAEFKHLQLHDLGIRKHDSAVNAETIEHLVETGQRLLVSHPAPA